MPRVKSVEDIVAHRQHFIDHIPQDLPPHEKERAQKAVNKSLDALDADDGETAQAGIKELLDVLEQYPDSGKGEPGPGHNLMAQYWLRCGQDCGMDSVGGGSVWGPAIYATCYWSCVGANIF